jgi:NADPH:quinone reductase-like Zn-dependent oxidoreductase
MAKAKAKGKASAARAPDVPATMRAAAIDRFGPPEVLTLHELPVPEPGPDEILIALTGAGVGVWDASIRDGSWRPPGRPRFPLIPGLDGAGVIVAKGPRARRFAIGEKVYASEFGNPKGGFYAEYVVVHAEHAGTVPRRLDLLHASAAVTTGLTALQGIDDVLRLKSKETILIFGASGAVGTLAVQFAKRLRARVLGTATGRKATSLVRELGADAVLDARAGNFLDRLREEAPEGLDTILALAGGDSLEQALDAVRAGGRVAYPNGVEPEPRRGRRNIRVLAYDGVAGPRQFAHLEKAVDEARLRVPIAAVYPLARAAEAHKRLEQGHIIGRIVLRIRRESR